MVNSFRFVDFIILDFIKDSDVFEDCNMITLVWKIRQNIICFGKLHKIIEKKDSQKYCSSIYKNLKFIQLVKGYYKLLYCFYFF